MTLNPLCPECHEPLWLEKVGEAVFDYIPAAPPAMRAYLARFGAGAHIWQCHGCFLGNYWLPARVV